MYRTQYTLCQTVLANAGIVQLRPRFIHVLRASTTARVGAEFQEREESLDTLTVLRPLQLLCEFLVGMSRFMSVH